MICSLAKLYGMYGTSLVVHFSNSVALWSAAEQTPDVVNWSSVKQKLPYQIKYTATSHFTCTYYILIFLLKALTIYFSFFFLSNNKIGSWEEKYSNTHLSVFISGHYHANLCLTITCSWILWYSLLTYIYVIKPKN